MIGLMNLKKSWFEFAQGEGGDNIVPLLYIRLRFFVVVGALWAQGHVMMRGHCSINALAIMINYFIINVFLFFSVFRGYNFVTCG